MVPQVRGVVIVVHEVESREIPVAPGKGVWIPGIEFPIGRRRIIVSRARRACVIGLVPVRGKALRVIEAQPEFRGNLIELP